MMWPFRKKPAPVEPEPTVEIVPETPPEPAEAVTAEPDIAQLVITAVPLIIGEGQDKIAYARYRLDAIRRHREQNEITLKWLGEARAETYSLIHALLLLNAMTADEEKTALAMEYHAP